MSLDDELEAFFDEVDDVAVENGEKDDGVSGDEIDGTLSPKPKRPRTSPEASTELPATRKAIVASSAPTVNLLHTENIQNVLAYGNKGHQQDTSLSRPWSNSMNSAPTSFYGSTMHQPYPSNVPIMSTLMQPQIGLGQAQEPPIPGGSGKAFKRAAAGQTWEDATLTDFPENDFRCFIGNLGKDVSDAKLAEAFSGRYPSFAMARVVFDKATKQSKGYGFVSFMDPTDCAKAIREMDKTWVGSRPIQIKLSDWKSRDLKEVRKKDKRKGKR